MKSLGVIETRGWVAAIQAVDAACKSAEVSCTGYRKVGAGRVSVCFEGEISAIHTAIERGMAAVNAVDKQSRSLVIARPEYSVTDALSELKGYPTCVKERAGTFIKAKADVIPSEFLTTNAIAGPASQAIPHQKEEKRDTTKKGKKT